MKRLLPLILFACVVTAAMAQNVTPQMLQQAKAMGVSDAQINQALGKKDNTPSQPMNVPADSTLGDKAGLRTVKQQLRSPKDSTAKADPGNTVFGKEIFDTQKLSFEPNFNMPTPENYILSAGDQLLIELWGNSEASYTRKIGPDGVISLPSVGVIFLSGKTISEAKKVIVDKLSSVYSEIMTGGINVRVSLGQIRSIRVNIAGEAVAPGTYTLPSLATLFNAMYMAGGVNDIGTLRDIRVYRNNKQVAALDVYDYIINGKYESNITLEDNDMIVVNPYRNHIKIVGKVKRNRIFELKDQETLGDLIRYAGDFTGDAYTENVSVNRKSGRFYQIYTVEEKDFSSFTMKDGDSVRVDSVLNMYDNRVSVHGAVWRPGNYQLSERVNTVKALVQKAEGLRDDAFFERVILRRKKQDYTWQVISLDIRAILSGSADDVTLINEDALYIPYKSSLKEKYYITVRGDVNGLKKEEADDLLAKNIDSVKAGKSYSSDGQDTHKDGYKLDYAEGMSVQDAILLAGGFKESASQVLISVVRRVKDPLSTSYQDTPAEVFEVALNNGLAFDAKGNDFFLQPFDEVIVRRSPAFVAQEFVAVNGEVIFPGGYNMTKNMRLTDLVAKSGGFTPYAYVEGAQLRRKLSESDLAKLEAKARMLENNAEGKDSLSTQMLEIPKYYVVGINLQEAMKDKGGTRDVILQEGDELVVPVYSSVVKISGAVVYPNAVTFEKNKSLKKYILNAGGYAQNAKRKAYVVYANGQVETVRGGIFRKYPKIRPGCEIIVPMKSAKKGLSLAEIMSLTSSTTSIAALVNSMVK